MGKKKQKREKKQRRWNVTELFHKCVEVTGGTWTDEERTLFWNLTAEGEGPGEKSYRKRMGWPLQPAGFEHGDFPDGSEGKSVVERTNGQERVQLVLPDLGKAGKKPNGRIVYQVIKFHEDVYWQHDERFCSGELNPNLFKQLLPLFQDEVSPNKTIPFSAIVLMNTRGFLRIPREDYVAAFRPYKTTKSSLRFKIERSYLEKVASCESA